MWNEAFHLFLDRNFRVFWHTKSTPLPPPHPKLMFFIIVFEQQKDHLISESQWNRLKLREGRLLQRGLLMYVPFFLPGIWWQTHLIQHPAPVGCDGFGWVKLGASYIIASRSAGAVLRNRVLFGEKFKYSLQPSICETILQSVVDISASSLPSILECRKKVFIWK